MKQTMPLINKNETLLEYFARLTNEDKSPNFIINVLKTIDDICLAKVNSKDKSFVWEIQSFGEYFLNNYNVATLALRIKEWNGEDSLVLRLYSELQK